MTELISFEDFEKIDIRVGRIVAVEDFPRAKVPSYKLTVDFGPELGQKRSSARFASNYKPDELLNQQCLAVVNFPPRNIAGFLSEVLVLGVPRPGGGITMVRPETDAELGGRLY